jgi:Alpha/beta hydrolase
VPGTGQDWTTIGGADAKALRMYDAALQADRNLGPRDVAVTTWMGYDRPMSLGHADFPDPARVGAVDLDAFEAGQRASHVGARCRDNDRRDGGRAFLAVVDEHRGAEALVATGQDTV